MEVQKFISHHVGPIDRVPRLRHHDFLFQLQILATELVEKGLKHTSERRGVLFGPHHPLEDRVASCKALLHHLQP